VKNRRRGADGFRNVFRDDLLATLGEDLSSSVSVVESQDTLTESDSEYSSASDDDSGNGSTYRNTMANRGSMYQRVGRLGKVKKAMSKSEGAQVMQERQMHIWDTLQVQTVDRISIMNKYSSEEYAPSFSDVISLWTQVALLVIFRVELKKVYINYQRGLVELPDDADLDWFFRGIITRVPPILKRSYIVDNPHRQQGKRIRPNPSDMDAEIITVLDEIRSYLTIDNEDEEVEDIDRQAVLLFLYDCSRHLDKRLLFSLDEAESLFHDSVPFGSTSCKEWLVNKAQKFPIPKPSA
jgi:hypothetical protein